MFYCGIRLGKSGSAMRTKDHIVPKSKGGTKTVEACLKCNAAKADKTLEQFRAMHGGIEFWGERAARIEREKTSWVYEFNAEKKVITPVDLPRTVYSATIDLGRLRQIHRPKKETKPPTQPPNLVGVRFGAFIVLRRLTGKWEVECQCGAIDHRSSRAITNPANTFDACEDCRKPIGKLRSEIHKATGIELSWEECFKRIYGSGCIKEEEAMPSPEIQQRHHHHHHKNDHTLLLDILDELCQIKSVLQHLHPLSFPTRIHSHFEGVHMPVTLIVGQTVVETISESNAAGPVPVVGANISVTTSDPSVATVVDNGDGTATWTAVAPGTATSTYTDTVFNLTGTDSITVTAAPPTAIESTFGTPAGV